jgi:outer membrane protein assembly factor BamD
MPIQVKSVYSHPLLLMQRILAIIFIGIGFFLSSCNDFSKLQKKGTPEEKYTRALDYYTKGDFVKAQMLFDELYPLMRTTDKAENIAYHLAFCSYNLRDYILAAYQFRSHFRSFPLSSNAEECLYMSAYCHYLNSPPYSLDQTDTYDAINEFQYFIQQFPNSKRIAECNKLIDKLYDKLQLKQFEISKQYYLIGDYKGAITALEQLIKVYPGTKYREEAGFITLQARLQLAKNSIDTRKETRLKETMDEYAKFIAAYPISPYSAEAQRIKEEASRLLSQIELNRRISNTN